MVRSRDRRPDFLRFQTDPDHEFLIWLAMEWGRSPRWLEANLTPGEFEDLKMLQFRKSKQREHQAKVAQQKQNRKRRR